VDYAIEHGGYLADAVDAYLQDEDSVKFDPQDIMSAGPYTVDRRVKTWKDFMGRERTRVRFAILDRLGAEVASSDDFCRARLWAMELTHNGFIEE
jgi:hypothetical protein